MRKPQRGAAERARHVQLVARAGASAREDTAPVNRSGYCNVDDERPGGAGDVAADDGNAGARGQRGHAVDERIDARHGQAGGSTSDKSATRGAAPMAARSLRFTASALWPMSAAPTNV